MLGLTVSFEAYIFHLTQAPGAGLKGRWIPGNSPGEVRVPA